MDRPSAGHRIKVYFDSSLETRWQKSGGSDVVADSGEGYKNFMDGFKMAVEEARHGDTIEVPPAKHDVALAYLEDTPDLPEVNLVVSQDDGS